MQTLLNDANKFAKESTWGDFALIKLCLCAVGVMWGMALPKKAHKAAAFIAVTVFITTYVPLMLKVFRVLDEDSSTDEI